MSPREQIQNELVAFLEANTGSFSAPYGIIADLTPVKNGKGKVRTVVFGVSRYLDAEILIWSPDKIQIRAQGGLAYKVEGDYTSVADTLTALKTLLREP
jgi:hypothetical protein